MKRIGVYLIAIILLLLLGVIWFIPFTSASNNTDTATIYCSYRLAVYECHFIEAEGYTNSDSDTFIGDIKLGPKVGGPLAYFGIKPIAIKKK